MMVRKIISGGLTVSDQAALDAAIRMGIPHGGWTLRGKMTETGPLPAKYQLKEMPHAVPHKCIEQNVLASKGTLIIFAGELTGNYAHAENITLKHKRHLLGINLKQTVVFKAASLLNDWIQLQRVEVLYVIGPSADEYSNTESHTKLIVEGALLLGIKGTPDRSRRADYSGIGNLEAVPVLPQTVEEAVGQIIAGMPLAERVRIANLRKKDLESAHMTLAVFIRKHLFQKDLNKELYEDCRLVSGNESLNEIKAPFLIIEKLWEILRKTHKLRAVKD